MTSKLLVVLLAGASLFAACKKDKNSSVPGGELPKGRYELIKSVQYNKAGQDSAIVDFPSNKLELNFYQDKKVATILGVADAATLTGSYSATVDGVLSNAVLGVSGAAATPKDQVIISLLEKGTSFEPNGVTVTIKSKDHGYLVFSTQK